MKTCFWLALLMMLVSVAQAQPTCRKTSDVCVAPNETRMISGMSIFRACWQYQATYECHARTLSDCQALRDKGCVQVGSECVDRNDQGVCTMLEQRYDCPDKPESYTERTICDQSAFCLNNQGCFDTSSLPDQDFGLAVAMLEGTRQAGVYGVGPDKVEIFKGYAEHCKIKVLGGKEIKSCCESAGGGAQFSNFQMMATSTAMEAGGSLIKEGSKYVYDSLFATVDSSLMKSGVAAVGSGAVAGVTGSAATGAAAGVAGSAATGAAAGVAGGAAAGAAATSALPTFGLYGFEFSFSMVNGFQFVGFDPYSFAAQIAIMMVQKWLACDPDAQVLAMKKGQNLCVHIKSRCRKKVVGVCVEKEEKYCCFNSKLARIINRSGRAQLGLPMDQCDGFSQDQLLAINFDQIDLTEFIHDIEPKQADIDALTQKAMDKVSNYYAQ